MENSIPGFYARTSTLDPGGPSAASIAELTWWMVAVFGITFLLVMILLMFGFIGPRKSDPKKVPFGEKWFILGGGLIFPMLVLTGLLIYTLTLTADLRIGHQGIPIRVTGHMWWWEVEYPEHGILTANEIYIPVGQAVQIELLSSNVIHSLWIPSLAGKMDLVPGLKNVISFEASEAGTYWGQCAEYCGLQHAKMSFHVVALPPEEFDKWIESKKASAEINNAEIISPGREIFHRVGCAECHRVKNTMAQGDIGPDLTHIGSRLSLGAGATSNSKGHLMGWISNPQALKPGNKMPRTYLKPEELHLLTDYLMNLK